MQTCPPDKAPLGGKLARDVRTPTGSLILGKGTLLTAPLVARLIKMGITEIALESEGADAAGELQGRLTALEQRFAGHEADSFMMALKQAIRTRFEQAAAGAAPNPPPNT